jgi:hypothetical protein
LIGRAKRRIPVTLSAVETASLCQPTSDDDVCFWHIADVARHTVGRLKGKIVLHERCIADAVHLDLEVGPTVAVAVAFDQEEPVFVKDV